MKKEKPLNALFTLATEEAQIERWRRLWARRLAWVFLVLSLGWAAWLLIKLA